MTFATFILGAAAQLGLVSLITAQDRSPKRLYPRLFIFLLTLVLLVLYITRDVLNS